MPCVKSTPLLCPETGRRLCGDCNALYLHMLADFSHDPSRSGLHEALSARDLRGAFLHAHALKGLCAQLALSALEKQAEMLCNLLRDGDPAALPSAIAQLPQFDQVYHQTLCAIHEYTQP